jgi:hypothetical protein
MKKSPSVLDTSWKVSAAGSVLIEFEYLGVDFACTVSASAM